MRDFYLKYQGNIHSQNGEDNIIAECLRRMDIKEGSCAEWGAHNGIWCSNTALLIEKGWQAFLIEYDNSLFTQCYQRYRDNNIVTVMQGRVSPSMINKIITHEYDLISIDTDGGNDYHCFEALQHLPKILIIEINSGFPPDVWHVSDEKGASYKSMVQLGIDKGYFLLCHTGNLIFVRNEYRELFPEIEADGLVNSEFYFNKSWL